MTVENRLTSIANAAAERYAELNVIRALVQLIPYAGGAVDTLLAGRGSKLIARRQVQLLENLGEFMGRLDQEKVDQAYIESEEFVHLLLRAFDHAARTSKTERIRLIARALACATTSPWGDRRADDSEALLDLAASLTVPEARALQLLVPLRFRQEEFRDDQKNDLQLFWAAGGKEVLSRIPEDVLFRLQLKGFIREITGPYLGYTGGAYTVTPLAVDIVEFLDAVGAEIEVDSSEQP